MLQLLLLLQVIVIIVLAVLAMIFWDRHRAGGFQQTATVQQSACHANTCNTCSTCQTQNVCSTCLPNMGMGNLGIAGVTTGAVGEHGHQDEIQAVVNQVVDQALSDALSGSVQNSVQQMVNDSVDSKVQTAVNDAVNSAVNNVVNDAIGDALSGAEQRLLTSASEAIGREFEAREQELLATRAYEPENAEATEEVTNAESVPDAVKALAAEQVDEFDALASRTSNFRSTENSFETSNDLLFDGSALKFKPETSEDVLTVFRGGARDDDGVFIFKRFGEDHTILAVNSPPSTEPFYGKEATLALVRGDEPNVEVVDFYNQDYPEAGVRQAGIRVIKEVGPEVTKSEWLPFAIDYAAHSTETKETTEFEVLKITPPNPQANVRVKGYMQIDVVNEPGIPPLEDCDAMDEHGRMKVDPREGVSLLYICTSDGWVAK